MPFYEYFCKPCRETYKTFHGIEEKCTTCPKCESNEVSKVIPKLSWKYESKKEASAGQRVEKFIEESREILEQDKKESRQDYKP
jgi:putative FmdB family regulatory protein